jgi:hypothetical protein
VTASLRVQCDGCPSVVEVSAAADGERLLLPLGWGTLRFQQLRAPTTDEREHNPAGASSAVQTTIRRQLCPRCCVRWLEMNDVKE